MLLSEKAGLGATGGCAGFPPPGPRFEPCKQPLGNMLGADEEPVDPKGYLEESCKPKCVKPLLEYQACVKRIRGDESGHKHCTGQYFDYWACIDKCVAQKLFSKLK